MPFVVNTGTEREKKEQRTSDSLFLKFVDRPAVYRELQKLGVASPNQTGLSDKVASQVWRINFAKGNIYYIDRWRNFEAGRAFYNSRTSMLAGKSLPMSWDFIKVYHQAPCPIVIINGDHDFSDMLALRYPVLLAGIPNVQLIILKNAGHNAWIDQPLAIQKELQKALQTH